MEKIILDGALWQELSALRVTQDSLEAILSEELALLYAEGQCGKASPGIPGKLLLTEPTESWGELAHSLSLNLPGQWWVGGASIAWVYGSLQFYLAHPAKLESIKDARNITRKLTGLAEEKLPCSASGCARAMLQWVNIRQMDARALDSLSERDYMAYQYCHPVDLAQGYLWDITSCYFSLLQRAPSPKVILLQGKLHFCPISREEETRWKAMLQAAAPHKGLRNSFIGQMYAQADGLYYCNGRPNQNHLLDIDYLRTVDGKTLYQNGSHLDAIDDRAQQEEKKAKPGPLRPLAALVVRTAYELCYLARLEEEAIYSNTDCVITRHEHSPKIWRAFGLTVALKASGPTNVHAIGYYRVGNDPKRGHTKPYLKGVDGRRPRVPHDIEIRLAGKLWCQDWLRVSDSWLPDKELMAKENERYKTKQTLREISKRALQR